MPKWSLLSLLAILLVSCATNSATLRGGGGGPPNMPGPSVLEREAQIANEETGNFFYGRRYNVDRTRFWGYLRKPRQPWSKAKLVIFNESKGRQPDRLPEVGPSGARYAFDNNYEYRIRGYYSGEKAYEINSDQFLDEFVLTGYELINRNPGWIFSPNDHYDKSRITLLPPRF